MAKVKQWLEWYDDIVKWHHKGFNCKQVALKLGKGYNTINRVLNCEEFPYRLELYRKELVKMPENPLDGMSFIKSKEKTIINELYNIAFEKKASFNVRTNILMWMAERLPHLAQKNIPQVTNVIGNYSVSKDDMRRLNEVALKIDRTTEVLRDGNPFVEGEVNTEEVPSETTDTSTPTT